MSNQKTTECLLWSLKGALYLILLTPLLVSPKYLFPFITTKTIYFRLLVELAVLLYITLVMIAPEFKPKMTKLSWAVVAFGLIIFITGITGVDFYKTFWGTIERGEGFLTISHLITYFLLLTWVLKSNKEWFNYLTAAVGVGVLVDFYALLQQAGVKHFFLFGRIIHPGESRLSATIGNAAFLGAYTLANFFLSLLLFLKRKHLAWKIAFTSAIILNFYVLFQTRTRGALLAWLIVSVLLSLFYALKSPNKLKKYVAIGILFLIIATSFTIWLNKESNWVQKNHTLKRLVSISRHDITTESRLLAWDTSWKGWKDRFLLGYGWENYNIAFNKYFHAEIFKDAGSQLWFDRAHNTIFDVAVATGIFGLICYLAIFGLALYYLFKNLKTDFDLSVILIALLVAHFLQNIFVFDVLASYIILFMTFALANFSAMQKKNQSNQEVNLNTKKEFNVLTFSIALIIILFAAYIFNIKPAQANRKSVKALIAANSNQEKQAVKFFQEAIEMKTYQTPEIRQKLVDNIILYNKTKNGLTKAEVYKNFKIGIEAIKDNIREHPLDVQNYLYLMAVLNKAGAYDAKYYDEVIKWGEKALVLSPTRPQIYFEMGQARVSQRKFEQGIEYFKKGVELNPKTMESHWNLMAAYIIAGKDKEAEKEYNLMKKNGYNFDNSQNLNRLYNIYLAAGRSDKMVKILEKLVALEPSGRNYARLAAGYKIIGELEKAKTAVKKAVELDPSLSAEAKKFLKELPTE